ncbi:alpha/beta hydrolase [Novosphingobium sp. FSW06-99]|uniref:RBBP9/YdeN family alpha/beta hydrolase n=1 Tax=Novosphingobium sp. FSW06-99 TaxID=1739113 RepID=UPI00076D486F|nr:alpha/beta hydrolase [Novosphingobium sp. FSW06-99]KUR74331.1 esterase [Novosphingobium sp. FSW06-99]
MTNLNTAETVSVVPQSGDSPDILLVPGLHNSGPGHWQTIWEERLPHARRVDLGLWDDPHRNTWVGKLALAIGRAERPVVLVAHSLGCHVVAWWAEYEAAFNAAVRAAELSLVVGALLVAPPEVEENPVDRRLTRFAPVPTSRFPFPTIVVASRDDPYASTGQVLRMARRWGAQFADAGAIGHVNARSGIGDWQFGLDQLRRLAPAAVPAAVVPDPAAITLPPPAFGWGAAR